MSKTEGYTDYWAIETMAGRIGLVVCEGCGAAVVVGDLINWCEIHDRWHEEIGIPKLPGQIPKGTEIL